MGDFQIGKVLLKDILILFSEATNYDLLLRINYETPKPALKPFQTTTRLGDNQRGRKYDHHLDLVVCMSYSERDSVNLDDYYIYER